MGFRSFEEIEAWNEARTLAQEVRELCKRAIAKKDWTWADQISRAAISVMANIAEGNDANTNQEFIAFLGYAKRSDAEVRSHLFYGLDAGYVEPKEFDVMSDRTRKIGAQLAQLIKYLDGHSDRHRRSSVENKEKRGGFSSNEPTSNE